MCTRFFFIPYKDMRYEGSSWQDIEHLLAAVLNWLVTVNAKSLVVLVMSYLCFSPFNGQVVMGGRWWQWVVVVVVVVVCVLLCTCQPLQWLNYFYI